MLLPSHLMFKLPSVRGFPATSNTLQICEHVADARDRSLSASPAPIVDLARLFPSPAPFRAVTPPPCHAVGLPKAEVSISYEERKLYIPTGKRRIRKKDGKPGSEEKIPFILVTVTATVSCGHHYRRSNGRFHSAPNFHFRVTNRATKVFDSRDNKRKPIADVRAELLRLIADADAANLAADALAEYLQPLRERKARPNHAVALAEADTPPTPEHTPSRAAIRTMLRLVRDPVLEYLRKPITPLPDFTS